MKTNENKPLKRSKIVNILVTVLFAIPMLCFSFMGNGRAENVPFSTPYVNNLQNGSITIRPSTDSDVYTFDIPTYRMYEYDDYLPTYTYNDGPNGAWNDLLITSSNAVYYTKGYFGNYWATYKTDCLFTWQSCYVTADMWNTFINSTLIGIQDLTEVDPISLNPYDITFTVIQGDNVSTDTISYNPNFQFEYGDGDDTYLEFYLRAFDTPAVDFVDNIAFVDLVTLEITRMGNALYSEYVQYYLINDYTAEVTATEYANMLKSIRGDVIVPTPTELLFSPIQSFLDLEIAPGISVLTLFIIAVAIGIIGVFLKFYAGG